MPSHFAKTRTAGTDPNLSQVGAIMMKFNKSTLFYQPDNNVTNFKSHLDSCAATFNERSASRFEFPHQILN